MKLIKDNFKISDIENANKNIKQAILDYVEQNRLYLTTRTHNTSNISLSHNPPGSYSSEIKDRRGFFRNDFNIFDKNNSATHKIHAQNESAYYKEVYDKLSDTDKVIFIKTISNHTNSYETLTTVTKNLDDNEFWRYVRNWAPFNKSSKQSFIFKGVFRTISEKSIDTEDKVQALYQFLNYYKPIVKRTDTKNTVIRLIKNKVEEKYHSDFEKLIGCKFEVEEQVDFLSKDDNLTVIKLDKDGLFEQLPMKNFPQAEVNTYNSLISQVIRVISENLSEDLGVENTTFVELSSKKLPARIYIEAKSGGFKEDIKAVFKLLLETGANIMAPNNKEELKKGLVDTFLYYKIQKEITEKNSENKDKEVKKTFKL